MMKFRLIQVALLMVFIPYGSSGVEGGERSPHPKSASHEHWILQSEYSDEFNEMQLDTAKWDNNVVDWGVWSWEPENAWVKEGYLHLRMQYHRHKRKGKTLFYTSGIIKSKASPIKYGYFEARIKAAQRFPGVCPAFWGYRIEKDLWTEIDFVELTQHPNDVKLLYTNTHVFRHPRVPNERKIREPRSWRSPWDPRDDFHVYGCEWNDKEINWYVDGKLVGTRKNEYWHQALDVVISFGVRPPLKQKPSDKEFPAVFKVDYVRSWKKATSNKPDAGELQ